MKEFKTLGFDKEESMAMVEALNLLLANYQVHYHKLRNFHWNVEGASFFELHAQFEQEYNIVKENIDLIAERIRVFGAKPYATMAKYLEVAEIEEPTESLTAREMVMAIIDDYGQLLSFMMDVASEADEIGDIATEDMMVGFIKETEKKHWMYSTFLKQPEPAV